MSREYILEPLKKEHGLLLKNWADHQDPLFIGYNYSDLSDKELDIWFKMKQERNHALYFSIFNKDRDLVGYIGAKEINKVLRTAKLGIVLNLKFISKGIGSIVLGEFLEFYFKSLNMRRLDLEVNAWNLRAINLYKKFNFKMHSSEYIKFENQAIDINKEKYKGYFEERNGAIFTKIYEMRLKRQEYLDEITD
ncbi:GNAT family N-acetyltransferase [Helcococcus ovis]|uniref:GNAT family N-acetyltransferase n=1 Tax=Helcococcus ovis TaxID=72026 RepID=UPI003916DE5F